VDDDVAGSQGRDRLHVAPEVGYFLVEDALTELIGEVVGGVNAPVDSFRRDLRRDLGRRRSSLPLDRRQEAGGPSGPKRGGSEPRRLLLPVGMADRERQVTSVKRSQGVHPSHFHQIVADLLVPQNTIRNILICQWIAKISI